jgi:hypothetical protein
MIVLVYSRTWEGDGARGGHVVICRVWAELNASVACLLPSNESHREDKKRCVAGVAVPPVVMVPFLSHNRTAPPSPSVIPRCRGPPSDDKKLGESRTSSRRLVWYSFFDVCLLD